MPDDDLGPTVHTETAAGTVTVPSRMFGHLHRRAVRIAAVMLLVWGVVDTITEVAVRGLGAPSTEMQFGTMAMAAAMVLILSVVGRAPLRVEDGVLTSRVLYFQDVAVPIAEIGSVIRWGAGRKETFTLVRRDGSAAIRFRSALMRSDALALALGMLPAAEEIPTPSRADIRARFATPRPRVAPRLAGVFAGGALIELVALGLIFSAGSQMGQR